MTRQRVPPEMAEAVIERDRREMDRVGALFGRRALAGLVCIAPILEPGAWVDCRGRTTIEHVKKDLRMGVRAENRMDRLVSLCLGHTEPGMKAGYIWNTNSRNRRLVRDYLARVEGVTT